jgi:hypothetical protein
VSFPLLPSSTREEEYKALVNAGAKRNGKVIDFTKKGDAAKEDALPVQQQTITLSDMFGKELRVISMVMFLAWPIGASCHSYQSLTIHALQLHSATMASRLGWRASVTTSSQTSSSAPSSVTVC